MLISEVILLVMFMSTTVWLLCNPGFQGRTHSVGSPHLCVQLCCKCDDIITMIDIAIVSTPSLTENRQTKRTRRLMKNHG